MHFVAVSCVALAVACVFIGIQGSISLHHHWSFKKDRYLETFGPRSRWALRFYALSVTLGSLAMSLALLIAAGVEKIPMMPIEKSLIIPAMQWMFVGGEGFLFLLTQRQYVRILDLANAGSST